MIISASYRTDIPAFYRDWFLTRFAAGHCMVANPYGGPPSRVALRQGVDGYVFWTRNARPFLPALEAVRAADLPFMLSWTVTGYPRPLEQAVLETAAAVDGMRRIAAQFGRRALVWRYDPILVTDLTPPEWHCRTFAGLARQLAGVVDEVVVSFAQIYRKTRRTLDLRGRQHGFAWRDPPLEEKREAVALLAGIAAEQGITLSVCSQPELEQQTVPAARCIDLVRLSDLAGRPLPGRAKGHRPGCACAESRDIGAYDSCPQGCVYCYAVGNRQAARDRLQRHDPDALSLAGCKGSSDPDADPA
jgi:hypothetical protein